MLKQKGFTLIELVMVITILGILSAIAIPTYINLQNDARTATVAGIAGALASGSAINYSARSANGTLGVPITDCDQVGTTLAGGLPVGYTITSAAVAVGATVNCTLTSTVGGQTAIFQATGIL